jgi:hypothetical protein
MRSIAGRSTERSWRDSWLGPARDTRARIFNGTVTLFENYCGVVGFGAAAVDQLWVVDISGGSVERGDLMPDREAVSHVGSPFGRAEQMASRSKMGGDTAEGR